MATHPTPPAPQWHPQIGEHLPGPNAVVLDRHNYIPPRPGMAANYSVLCIMPGVFLPFVIWPSLSAMTTDTETAWLVTSSGDYYATLDEAQQAWDRTA